MSCLHKFSWQPNAWLSTDRRRNRVVVLSHSRRSLRLGCAGEKNSEKQQWTKQGQQYPRFLMGSPTPTHDST
ncbi:homeobox protein SIX3/6 [Sarotherodon galilaeus]